MVGSINQKYRNSSFERMGSSADRLPIRETSVVLPVPLAAGTNAAATDLLCNGLHSIAVRRVLLPHIGPVVARLTPHSKCWRDKASQPGKERPSSVLAAHMLALSLNGKGKAHLPPDETSKLVEVALHLYSPCLPTSPP